jgi:hypothetical protein
MASDCRQKAEEAASSVDKEAWLKLADDWVKLARGEEPGTSEAAGD